MAKEMILMKFAHLADLHLGKKLSNSKSQHKYFPENFIELREIIKTITNEHKTDDVIDLNDIDTSKITGMDSLFIRTNHNYDISEWNVSNVRNMRAMFYESKFNGDISKWNVSNVKTMESMFDGANFNQDISQWDVSAIVNIKNIFTDTSLFNKDLTKWCEKLKNKRLIKQIENYI